MLLAVRAADHCGRRWRRTAGRRCQRVGAQQRVTALLVRSHRFAAERCRVAAVVMGRRCAGRAVRRGRRASPRIVRAVLGGQWIGVRGAGGAVLQCVVVEGRPVAVLVVDAAGAAAAAAVAAGRR